MKQVTIENVRERIARIEECASRMPGGLRLSMNTEFELACLRQLLAQMQSVQVLPTGWRMVPTASQPGIDDDVRNVVALLENNEWAEHCTSTELGQRLESEITRLYNWRSAQQAPEHHSMFDVITSILDGIDRIELDDGWWETSTGAEFGKEKLEEIRAAMLSQQQQPATDNTAQQFEALATGNKCKRCDGEGWRVDEMGITQCGCGTSTSAGSGKQ